MKKVFDKVKKFFDSWDLPPAMLFMAILFLIVTFPFYLALVITIFKLGLIFLYHSIGATS